MIEEHTAGAMIKRHWHPRGYAAVVISGAYEEAGVSGRYLMRSGMALIHAGHDVHLDRFGKEGARILNIALPDETTWQTTRAVQIDVDALVRDPAGALELLSASAAYISAAQLDWPDILALEMVRDPTINLRHWSMVNGLRPETVSRGFQRVYGVTAKSFRAEVRLRHALTTLRISTYSLAEVSAMVGFSDQAHMSRAVHALTGSSPRAYCNLYRTRSTD